MENNGSSVSRVESIDPTELPEWEADPMEVMRVLNPEREYQHLNRYLEIMDKIQRERMHLQ